MTLYSVLSVTEKIDLDNVAAMKTTESSAAIDRIHEAEIIQALSAHGAMSRAELSESISLGRSALSVVLTRLMDNGTVVIAGTEKKDGRGRPSERLEIDARGIAAIGIDCTHAGMHVIATSITGAVLAEVDLRQEDDTWAARGEMFDRAMVELALQDDDLAPLRAVAIGLPGPIRLEHEWLDPEVPLDVDPDAAPEAFGSAECLAFLRHIGSTFGKRMMIDNTVRFQAYAEHMAAENSNGAPTVYIRCFQGVGGAVVSSGGMVRGTTGMAGEIGHLMVNPGGRLCRCGRYGCLETVASTPFITAKLAEMGLPLTTVEDIRDAYEDGDRQVKAVLEDVGDALGLAILLAATMADPARVIVSGEAVAMAPIVLNQAIARYHHDLGHRFTAVPVLRGRLGDEAGATGAALAVIHHDLPALGAR